MPNQIQFKERALVDFFAISIAMINPRISASKANLMPRYLAKQPFKKPLQLLKIPPQPECPRAPFAAHVLMRT